MNVLKIVVYVIVCLAVILPGYFIRKKKITKGQRLISAVAGTLLLLLVFLAPNDPPGSIYAKVGLIVMGIVPIFFWIIDLIHNPKAPEKSKKKVRH